MLFPVLLAPPVLRVQAEPIPAAARLRVRLKVTNVSATPQPLWIATGGCTNARWSVSNPWVWVADDALARTKTCTIVCQHRRTLRPGETFVRTVEPGLVPWRRLPNGKAVGIRPGPLTLDFALAQPNPATADDRSLPEAVRDRLLEYRSAPVRVDVKRAWLRRV